VLINSPLSFASVLYSARHDRRDIGRLSYLPARARLVRRQPRNDRYR
jgi:hypothetical protein